MRRFAVVALMVVGAPVAGRCDWKVGGAAGGAAEHLKNETNKLVNRADQGINNGWSHVKNDWGPAINKGINHFAKEVSADNFHTSSECQDGSKPNHACYPTGNSPRPAPNDPITPDVPLQTVSGQSLTASYRNIGSFDELVEVYDLVAGAWTQRDSVPAGAVMPIHLRPGTTGHGDAMLRFDHDKRNDTEFAWITAGQELH